MCFSCTVSLNSALKNTRFYDMLTDEQSVYLFWVFFIPIPYEKIEYMSLSMLVRKFEIWLDKKSQKGCLQLHTNFMLSNSILVSISWTAYRVAKSMERSHWFVPTELTKINGQSIVSFLALYSHFGREKSLQCGLKTWDMRKLKKNNYIKIFETWQKVYVYELKSFKTSTCFNTTIHSLASFNGSISIGTVLLEDHGKKNFYNLKKYV